MLWSRVSIHRDWLPRDVPTQRSGLLQTTRSSRERFSWYEDLYRDIRRTDRVPEKLPSSLELPREEKGEFSTSSVDGYWEILDDLASNCWELYRCKYSQYTWISTVSHFCESLLISRVKNSRRSERVFFRRRVIWWMKMRSSAFRYFLTGRGWEDYVSEEELWVATSLLRIIGIWGWAMFNG